MFSLLGLTWVKINCMLLIKGLLEELKRIVGHLIDYNYINKTI